MTSRQLHSSNPHVPRHRTPSCASRISPSRAPPSSRPSRARGTETVTIPWVGGRAPPGVSRRLDACGVDVRGSPPLGTCRPGLARSQTASAVTDQLRRAKFRVKSLSGERTERRHNARALCLESGGRGACELVHSDDFRCKPRDPKGASHNSNYAQRRRVRLYVRSPRPQLSGRRLRPGGGQEGGPLPPGRHARREAGAHALALPSKGWEPGRLIFPPRSPQKSPAK